MGGGLQVIRKKLEELTSQPRKHSTEDVQAFIERINESFLAVHDIIDCDLPAVDIHTLQLHEFQAYVNCFAYALKIWERPNFIKFSKNYLEHMDTTLINSKFVMQVIKKGYLKEIEIPKLKCLVIYFDDCAHILL